MCSGRGMSGGRWPRRWRCCRCGPCWSTSGPTELRLAPAGVETVLTPLPEEVVRGAAPGGAFVVMTHEHALDFLVVREALARGDAAYVGMIGSRTKRASFLRWLRREGGGGDATPLVCPIGAAGRPDKRPEVIAAFVAVEIMQKIGRANGARKPAEASGLREVRTNGTLFELKGHGTNVRTEVIAGVDHLPDDGLYHLRQPADPGHHRHGPQRGLRRDLPRGGAGVADHGALCQLADRDGAGHGAERLLRLQRRRRAWASPGSRRWARCSSRAASS